MVLLISYDLQGRERPASYARVKAFIEQHAVSSYRPLYSQWFVETARSPQAWVDAMQTNKLIDADDRLLVCPVSRPLQGLLDNTAWAWLMPRL